MFLLVAVTYGRCTMCLTPNSSSASVPEVERRYFDRKGEDVGVEDDLCFEGCLRDALSVAPDSFAVNKEVGFYFLGTGNTSKAEKYLKHSYELNRNQPDVARALGRLGVVIDISPQSSRVAK